MSLVGTWNLESSENWDEYLKEMGVGFVMRKAAGAIKPTIYISNNGNQWTIKVQSTLKTTESTGTEGVEFDETTADGRDCKSTLKMETPTKMVVVMKDAKTNEYMTTVTRELVDEKMVQTLVAGNVKCTRIYKRSA